jgi:dihydrofolate reductase
VLIHELARHKLIDEYSLLVYPLTLGSGKRVFPDDVRVDLKLIETKTFPTGVVLMRYEVNNG